jgi:hypothetical protein
MHTFDEATTGRLVDDLGELRAQIADLQDRAKRLESVLRESGDGTYQGALFRATVTTSERSSTAWKTVAEKAGASRQLITAHTSTKEVTTLRVTARLKDAA